MSAEAAPAHLARPDPIGILIVDDEPKNLTVLETVLSDPGYRLVRALSAEEALLALIAHEFALLILDIQMPGMTGFELAELVKQRKKSAHVPIIFLTAYYNQDEHVLEGYGTGAVDYLHKPVNASVLRSKVSVFADLYRKSHELELANRALLEEVDVRRRIQDELHELNETLEQRVTERTEALRENESRLRHAVNAARLTYEEVDFRRGEIRRAENFNAVMGYAVPDAAHTSPADSAKLLLAHVNPEDRDRVTAALREFGQGKPVSKLDYSIAGDDLEERSIESQWFVEMDSDGALLKSFVTNLDITQRKAAEERLRSSEERFRQLADSMPPMVWTARPDGSLDYYNARWYDFTGFSRETGSSLAQWESLLFHDDWEPFFDAWQASLENGKPFHAEYRLWNRYLNRYSWFLGRALPVRDEDNRVMKWIGTCTDIDDQKRSEQHLRRANEALEQFAFAASHDLQEPLRNVAIYSQLFAQRYGAGLDEEGTKFLGFIREGAQRMARLVSDLLAYTQIISLSSEPQFVTDAAVVVEKVLQDLTHAIESSHAIITHDSLPRISMKDVHLAQLMQNLIGNAIKYRKDDVRPEIGISAFQDGSKWHFVVRDNGIGIDAEYCDLIFGVFKRLHANGAKYEGTGIGLAICQKIVDHYGGRIWAESEPGSGSAFHFTVPAAPVSA